MKQKKYRVYVIDSNGVQSTREFYTYEGALDCAETFSKLSEENKVDAISVKIMGIETKHILYSNIKKIDVKIK